MMNTTNTMMQLSEIAERIRELREIMGWSAAEMADKTEVTPEAYALYESGSADIPFTFIHKCALAFNVELTELLEGRSAHLSSYTVTRKGKGQETAKEDGIEIMNLAPNQKATDGVSDQKGTAGEILFDEDLSIGGFKPVDFRIGKASLVEERFLDGSVGNRWFHESEAVFCAGAKRGGMTR